MKVFIIHGAYGSPQENWIPWLKFELKKIKSEVIIPAFPTPEGQSLKNWMSVFERYLEELDEDTILIGHSIGATFVLRVLEKIKKQIKASFLVAGVLSYLNIEEFDNINRTFIEKEFNTKKIRQNCKKFYIINSDNDPYIPLDKAERLAQELNTKVIIVKNAGHFNIKAGYAKFEFLLEKIKKEL
ncbi:serine hydrolase family protein [Candidatus Woesearchaeota archaeon]|nr:serine hydrolase family protein [Candidatus Woesearchaeota archaeon]